MKNKKSQIELVGLIFIVLIITIILLFYLSYSVESETTPKGRTTLQTYQDSEITISFIDAALKTSVCGRNIRDLIVDCASYKKVMCDENTLTSCEKLNETLMYVKNQTLDAWGINYGMVIDYNDGVRMFYNHTEGCPPDEIVVGRGYSGPFIIPLDATGKIAKFKLVFCN